MKLLPYDTFTIQTPDPLPLVLERLATQIEPQKTIRWHFSRNHLPYEGTLSETGFKIRRIIHYRNSFLPLIRGQFEPAPSGTIVRVTLRLHPAAIAFWIVWYLVLYSFFFHMWWTKAMPVAAAWHFLGLSIALLAVFWAAFWAEAHRSRRDLVQMIQGHADRQQSGGKVSQWLPNVLQWGVFLLGFIIALFQMTGTFHPAPPPESESLATMSCSQHPSQSFDCKFSLIRTLNGHPEASALAISADGQTLISGGSDKAIKVWDLKTGQLRKTLQSDSGKINAVAIAPDGKTVVSGSADRRVRIWDLTTDQRPRMLVGHAEDVNLVGITPDGKTIISGSYGAIKQWDLKTGQLKATFPKVGKSETKIGPISVIDDEAERFNPLDINPNSNTALISDLKVVDLSLNQTKTIPTNKVENLFADYFLSAHMSPDGKLAALQYGNTFRKFETRLKVWDLTTGDLKAESSATFSHTSFTNVPLALSRDRIFGSTGKQLKIWNIQTAQLEAVLDTGWVNHLVVTPDGKFLAGLAEYPDPNHHQIKVWQHQ